MSEDSITMPTAQIPPNIRPLSSRRRSRFLIVLFLLVIALGVAGYFYLSDSYNGTGGLTPILIKVEKGSFTNEVTNRGNVESATNIEIECEVRSKSSGGIEIIKIVDNGFNVKEGEVIIELNSEQLEADKEREQIEYFQSQAALIQAKSTLAAAKSSLEEYKNGQYVLDLQTIDNQIAVANEDYRRAKEYYEYSQQLEAKGYITEQQLEADRFAMEKASNELEAAKMRRNVLETYTRTQKLAKFNADIETAQAKLNAQQRSHDMQIVQRDRVVEQVEKCTIKAPCDGQVVYANRPGGHGRDSIVIEKGTSVREGQVIVRIQPPTATDMQVKVNINESHINRIHEGLPVRITLDAFREVQLEGTVKTVSPYPLPTPWYNSLAAREYETIVCIDTNDPCLRPGLTAEVKIIVEELPEVVRVPVQAVFGHGDKNYCVMLDEKGHVVKREVKIGSSNEKFVVISEGLNPDELIAEHANAFRDQLDLPPLDDMPTRGDPGRRPPGMGGGRPSHAMSPGGSGTGVTSTGGGIRPLGSSSGRQAMADGNASAASSRR